MAPVRVLGWVLCPVAWPVAGLLDCLLGEELGRSYSKDELAALLALESADGKNTAFSLVCSTAFVAATPALSRVSIALRR